MINYLKEKKEIDHIILLLRFGERLTNEKKQYLELLGKIFTPSEFFSHLSIIFTDYHYNNPRKKRIYIEEINLILRNIFNISKE